MRWRNSYCWSRKSWSFFWSMAEEWIDNGNLKSVESPMRAQKNNICAPQVARRKHGVIKSWLRPRFKSDTVPYVTSPSRYSSDNRKYRMRTTHYRHSLYCGNGGITAELSIAHSLIVRKFGSSWKFNTGIMPKLSLPKHSRSDPRNIHDWRELIPCGHYDRSPNPRTIEFIYPGKAINTTWTMSENEERISPRRCLLR